MSGHTEFTWWIKREAKHAIHKSVKKDIKDVFFTSAQGSNDENLIIAFADGETSENFKDVDYADLSRRYNARVRFKHR